MGNSISSPAIEHRDMALQVLTYCDVTDMMQLKRKCISMDSNLVVDIAVAQKCPVSKVFMSNDELYAAVSLLNEIHYQHEFHQKYHGAEGRLLLRKAAEFIAVKYGWNISLWDVSHITSFRCLFCDCHDFNLPKSTLSLNLSFSTLKKELTTGLKIQSIGKKFFSIKDGS